MTSPKPPTSRLASWQDYLTRRDIRGSLSRVRALSPHENGAVRGGRDTLQHWSEWAGRKIKRNIPAAVAVNEVELFPGWATRRPLGTSNLSLDEYERAFDVHIHISGLATSRRTPEVPTRSQRTFLKLAKTFAALPKVQASPPGQQLADVDEALHGLRLPPRPDEIPDDYVVQDLDRQLHDVMEEEADIAFSDVAQLYARQPTTEASVSAQLHRLHENLESRLRPFWTSALSSRIVHVSIFAHSTSCHDTSEMNSSPLQPLVTGQLNTGSDGFFSGTFSIAWQDICQHPAASRIALDKACLEHELLVRAHVVEPEHSCPVPRTAEAWIPITQSTVRVISDIDDTVKMSKILDGARAVFHNVFVKDLEETVIPGMSEWYRTLWEQGVGFHYVSNSPYELLSVIKEFLYIAGLPPGSIRLRSYTRKSLFDGVLSAPGARKRANVIEVLDHFPNSKFLLIGDSGEQDMELYAQLAAERPDQIAGVFIRDVAMVGLEDPTGNKASEVLIDAPRVWRKGSTPLVLTPGSPPRQLAPKRAMTDGEPLAGSRVLSRSSRKPTTLPSSSPPQRETSQDSFETSASGSSSSTVSSVSSDPTPLQLNKLGTFPITEDEKKRWELQSRVYRARSIIPSHIPFRVFEDPRQCVEAERIAEQYLTTYPGAANS
ncbi:hypothetical protein ID866_4526 [Astraeus odoratus]|nr:hypothetical protein ID866_4526 [Astraeus odoratus]